jgi:hypothetical protein
MLPETTQPLLCDDGDTHAVEEAVTVDEEPAPAAVRPLGRLGGDDGGWALALDYRSPPDDADASESTNESAKEEKEAERLEGWLR